LLTYDPHEAFAAVSLSVSPLDELIVELFQQGESDAFLQPHVVVSAGRQYELPFFNIPISLKEGESSLDVVVVELRFNHVPSSSRVVHYLSPQLSVSAEVNIH
jgi:hypothetical protein